MRETEAETIVVLGTLDELLYLSGKLQQRPRITLVECAAGEDLPLSAYMKAHPQCRVITTHTNFSQFTGKDVERVAASTLGGSISRRTNFRNTRTVVFYTTNSEGPSQSPTYLQVESEAQTSHLAQDLSDAA